MTKQLRNIPRPKGSKVSGIGVYRPKRIVSNDEIAPLIDSSDQWIRERSGIIETKRTCKIQDSASKEKKGYTR
jgi:3-oxoacyl-[acyl-carrier-protein] synthase-3